MAPKSRLTPFEQQRQTWCKAGHSVLANGHHGMDEGLRAWARRSGRLVWIDRRSLWGNPHEPDAPTDDVQRQRVVQQYAVWLETQPDLLTGLDVLAGKVLVCWCTPRICHGEVLLEHLDPQFAAAYIAVCQEHLGRPVRPLGTTPMQQLSLF
jgi:hypothetical protein